MPVETLEVVLLAAMLLVAPFLLSMASGRRFWR